jgi:hypothetical protein
MTHQARSVASATALVAVALALSGRARVDAQNQLPLPIRLNAFAVNMSNIGTGASGMVDIRITQWSTADERKRVIETMVDKGQDKLLSLLQDLPVKGRLRFPNLPGPDRQNLRLGWDIRYAWTTAQPEGGHRIVVALDRYMSFAEVRNQPRTVDYPFTLIEVHLNKDLEGEGKMAFETKIAFDKKKNTVELENYSSEPVRLTTVKAEKGSSGSLL